MRKANAATCAIVSIALTPIANAGAIDRSDFGPGAIVENYDGVFPAGTGSGTIPSGTVIGNATYTVSGGLPMTWRENIASLWANSSSPTALYTAGSGPHTTDLTFNTDVNRVGLDIGLSVSVPITVEFYDEGNLLLHSESLSITPHAINFVGFEHDAGLISRVRLVDSLGDGASVAYTNVTTEFIPTPATAATACLAVIGLRRRRAPNA